MTRNMDRLTREAAIASLNYEEARRSGTNATTAWQHVCAANQALRLALHPAGTEALRDVPVGAS